MFYSITLFLTLAVALAQVMAFNSLVQVSCDRPNTFKCRDNGLCIRKDALCDLYDDCEDGSDENNCPDHVCRSDEFRCNSGQCVYQSSRCDGGNNCADNSDEENCLQCNQNSWGVFKCESNQKCIYRDELCNSINDCPDGSDEDKTTCQNLQCSSREFQCRTGHCINANYRCDHFDICRDNSGNNNCTACGRRAFKCEKENKCIPEISLCDMEPDCEDGSDESETTCRTSTCSYRAFRCQNGQCAQNLYNSYTLLCNGHNDCKDESDETYCAHCSPQAYKCGSGECVHNSELCNTILDCSDGSDENEINCPEGSTLRVWTTFWHLDYISPNTNVTLQYLTEDLAIYFDSSVNSSVTWPFLPLSMAWKYAKTTFGKNSFLKPGTGSQQRLYVVLGKLKTKSTLEHLYTFSFTDPRSGYRNILDAGLRERNGWATENSGNFEKLFSILGLIVKMAEEGTFTGADYKICNIDMSEILFYDIYIFLKGEGSADVLRWRANQFNKTLKVGRKNCFRDWLLPIYETYGGATVLRNYFEIIRMNMAKKKGVYSDSHFGIKQLNSGELVHFWSGAAKVDLLYLAKSMFTVDQVFMKQFTKAQIDFPNIKYAEEGVTTDVVDVLIRISLYISILFFVALVVKLSLPHVIAKYNALVEQYW